jgi:hypothetical protein
MSDFNEKFDNTTKLGLYPIFTGVDRDEVQGVRLCNATLFCRTSSEGVSTHLYGDKVNGHWQVCSPIRSIQKVGSDFVFLTRSYNKYVVNENDFQEPALEEDEVYVKLQGWMGSDKVEKVFNVEDGLGNIPLFEGEPTEFEKYLYKCLYGSKGE